MSIPKAPISFLKFILGIFLILNLAAEMCNPLVFRAVDRSFQYSDIVLDASCLESQERFDRNFQGFMEDYEPFQDRIQKTNRIIALFMRFMDTIRTGLDHEVRKNGTWSSWKDKDIPQNYFLRNDKATEIKHKIMETQQQLQMVLDSIYSMMKGKGGRPEAEIQRMREHLQLKIEEQDWEVATFGGMSVAGCHAMLSKVQNDARIDEITIINYLTSKITICGIVFDRFEPESVPIKPYVIEGDTFKTEIFLKPAHKSFRGSVFSAMDSVKRRFQNR